MSEKKTKSKGAAKDKENKAGQAAPISAADKLAELVDAEYLFILTAVDHMAINYGKPNQKELQEMTLAEAERYCAEGQFAPGSMLPKVQAAMNFVKSGKGRKAIIASLEKAPEAIEGKSGTVIHM